MPKLTQVDLWINEQIERGRSFNDSAMAENCSKLYY